MAVGRIEPRSNGRTSLPRLSSTPTIAGGRVRANAPASAQASPRGLAVTVSLPSLSAPPTRLPSRDALSRGALKLPSLSEPPSRAPSRLAEPNEPADRSVRPARFSAASLRPTTFAPLSGDESFERAASRLELSLRMLNSNMGHLKRGLADPRDGVACSPVVVSELKSQVAQQLATRVTKGELAAEPHILFVGHSPWRSKALSKAVEVRAPVPRSPVKLLSPRRFRY